MLNFKSLIKRDPISIFHEDCVLEGQIHFGKKTVLLCPVKGELSASGSVDVTDKCQMQGNADFYECQLMGSYTGGHMTVQDRLTIGSQAKFVGSALTSSIEIQAGSDFQIDLELLPLLGEEKKKAGSQGVWGKIQGLWKK